MTHDIGNLKDHSDRYLTMAFRTDRHRMLVRADGVGRLGGECRDAVTFYLRVSDGRIDRITYVTQGCINTAACANTVIELAEHQSIEHAWSLQPDQIVDYLETLPDDHVHCAQHAIAAFRQALANYQQRTRNRWKQPYR